MTKLVLLKTNFLDRVDSWLRFLSSKLQKIAEKNSRDGEFLFERVHKNAFGLYTLSDRALSGRNGNRLD